MCSMCSCVCRACTWPFAKPMLWCLWSHRQARSGVRTSRVSGQAQGHGAGKPQAPCSPWPWWASPWEHSPVGGSDLSGSPWSLGTQNRVTRGQDQGHRAPSCRPARRGHAARSSGQPPLPPPPLPISDPLPRPQTRQGCVPHGWAQSPQWPVSRVQGTCQIHRGIGLAGTFESQVLRAPVGLSEAGGDRHWVGSLHLLPSLPACRLQA